MEKGDNCIRYYSIHDRILTIFYKAGFINQWDHTNNDFVKHHEATWTLNEGFDELSTQFARNLYFTILHEIPKEGKVIEIGCGGGGILASLVKTQNNSLIISDISYIAVHKSVSKSKSHGMQINSESIPIRSETISCAYSTEMLEHVPNPEAVIKEVSRILKQDGIFVFSIPCGSVTFIEDFAVTILKGIVCKILLMPPPVGYRGHVHIFNEKIIYHLAEKYKFNVINKYFIKSGKGERVSSLPPKPFYYDVIRFFELPSDKNASSIVYVFQKK
jgi:2-polyprenyl-3-methyl-5-hydroxy-6-metoxy-1,4-benzoquinol methylase